MNILAINPWIYDFAAYDFWLKPYGFLVLLTYFKKRGINIEYIDCLNKKETLDNFGRGKYYSEIISKPDILKSVPRIFRRYGLRPQEFEKLLHSKKPDFIFITSSMTYWYSAIEELTKTLKHCFPKTPIVLGGTYATLCYEHAKNNILYDCVFRNEDLEKFFKLLNIEFNYQEFYSTFPKYDYFYRQLDYVVFRTSWGCPFRCSYCAINKLFPDVFRIPKEKIIHYILKYYKRGIKNFVLYDDAFLYPLQDAKKLLKEIEKLKINVNFHTPNALHLRFLDQEIANLLKRAGFVNPHFGLETLNPSLQEKWGDKVNTDDVIKGISFLKKGGFRNGQFSIYLLLGYPNQNLEHLKKEVEFLNSLGAKVSLAEFSPTPQTKIFQDYKDKLNEPLLHNNSIFGFFSQDKLKDFYKIKNYTRTLNKKITQ